MSTDDIKTWQRQIGVTPDGVFGPATLAASMAAVGATAPAPAPAGAKMARIIMHWSAGTYTVSALDREHYHFIVGGDGAVVAGDHPVSANANTADGSYAAHTKGCNTGSIGVAMAAMAGAVEYPFSAGAYPIRPGQLTAFVGLVAQLARDYGIPVSRETVLTHAEVQPTLGIAQNGKWDIMWLPGMPNARNAVTVGDTLRDMIRSHMKEGT